MTSSVPGTTAVVNWRRALMSPGPGGAGLPSI